MSKQCRFFPIIGCAGLLLALSTGLSEAQINPFDGTYAPVSSTKLSQTSVTRGGDLGVCPDAMPGPLTISQGQVSYVGATGRQLVGTVTPEGQLSIRVMEARDSTPFEMDVNGTIDTAGTVHARQRGRSCSYDLVWRKQG